MVLFIYTQYCRMRISHSVIVKSLWFHIKPWVSHPTWCYLFIHNIVEWE